MGVRSILWCLMTLGLTCVACAADVSPGKVLLNGVWERAIAPDGPVPEGGWQKVRVPHRSREFESEPPESAWYRTSFRVPDVWTDEDARIVLSIGRVRHYARVYVNGSEVGEHHGMRTPLEVDLTGRAGTGEEAQLVVYTHNASGQYAHPEARDLSEKACRALDTIFWHTSALTVGIEGDAWLKRVPKLRIEDIRVVTSVRRREITVRVRVTNERETAARADLGLSVMRRGEVELALDPTGVELDPGESRVVEQRASWKDPVLWGRPPYGQPVLYFVRASLGGSGTRIETRYQRFGFREIWTEGGRILLNGRPLFLWGDHSIPYVHERQWLTRKLPALVRAGSSVVEHHRYGAPPVLYEVADELGMFVISSNFCVGTAAMPADLTEEEKDLVMQNHVRATEHWIRRDRNHPSILLWNVTDNWRPDYCMPLLRRARELDGTRITDATYRNAPPEMLELMDTYQLFSSLGRIQGQIESIRASAELPEKPIRVGEAGIFREYLWDFGVKPPLKEGWGEFIDSMPERKICGLQTFSLTDMDYRGFKKRIPGMLFRPVEPEVSWPTQSGLDARIDPFGRGTAEARGKAALYLNWCDPSQPVSRPTPTAQWWSEKFTELTGREVGQLSETRVPEVIVHVRGDGTSPGGGYVFAEPLEGQGLEAHGIRPDADGRAWFVLPEPGRYRFQHAGHAVEVVCEGTKIDRPPGYGHIQRVELP